MRPTHLRNWQEQFISSAVSMPIPARLLLVAPVGLGKTTAVIELARRLADQTPRFRMLAIYDRQEIGRNLLARAHATAGLEETPIEKKWLRTVAASNKPHVWPQRVAAGIAARDLREEWVQRALAETNWDLVVADEIRDADNVREWLTRLRAPRIVVASSVPRPGWIDLPGWITSNIGAAQLVLDTPSTQTAQETVEFERSLAEVELLRLVHDTAALADGFDDWGANELSSAAESSPFALQAAALRLAARLRPLRNSYAHGRTADDQGVSKEREVTLSRIVPYFAGLEKIIEGVDALNIDARFEAFFRLVVDRLTPLQTPFVVFTRDQRTAEYIVDRLRFMQRPVELVGPGWNPSETPQPSTAFVVPDEALQGLDLGIVSIGVHYDAAGPRALLREARLSPDSDRTILTLRDTSSALHPEPA
jgi:DNA polymerase III delta prime subunit